MSASHRSWGLLLMRRLYSQRDIQLDINLLTTAFTAALANALERTLAPTPLVIAMPADSPLIAAQAG
jgi:hypothetical protein